MNCKFTDRVLTPLDIITFCNNKALNLVSNFEECHVIVRGILGELKPNQYNKYYGISLKGNSNDTIILEIPKPLVNNKEAYQFKEVVIHGNIKCKFYNNSVTFYIDVSNIEPTIELSDEVKEQEATLLEFIKKHQKEIRLFPNLETYKVTVIHGINSEVKADFENQIKDIQRISIEYKPVNITSPDAIKSLLLNIQTDILVIIRGGGSSQQFEVFNDYELLKAWLNNPAYKISALGHTEQRTLLDFFSHASCDTPTACGKFIEDNIELLNHKKDKELLLQEHQKNIETLLKEQEKKIDEINKSKDAIIELKDKSIKEYTEKIEKTILEYEKKQKDLLDKLMNTENKLTETLIKYEHTVKQNKLLLIGISLFIVLLISILIVK